MKLQITVTKEHLAKSAYCTGNAHSIGSNCAISVAVRDIFPNAWVGNLYIHPFGYEMGSEIMHGQYGFIS